MLRPAGPRISSMMPLTRSAGRYCCSSRSVPSNVPIKAPEADIRETNSSNSPSTTSASIVPRVDIAIDSSRTSSSSSNAQILPPYCSPSASIRIAARCGPFRAGAFLLPWRVARVARTLLISLELALALCAGRAMSVRSLRHPLTDNRYGFVRIAFDQFADAVHGLSVKLTLDLGDVDRGVGRHQVLCGRGRRFGQRHDRLWKGRDHLGGQDAA